MMLFKNNVEVPKCCPYCGSENITTHKEGLLEPLMPDSPAGTGLRMGNPLKYVCMCNHCGRKFGVLPG